VRWYGKEAARVEVVFSGRPARVVPLAPAGDDRFEGSLTGERAARLAVLVTRRDGRAVWAELAVEPA